MQNIFKITVISLFVSSLCHFASASDQVKELTEQLKKAKTDFSEHQFEDICKAPPLYKCDRCVNRQRVINNLEDEIKNLNKEGQKDTQK